MSPTKLSQKYTSDLRVCCIRLFREQSADCARDTAAHLALASKPSCSLERFRAWRDQATCDGGERKGLTSVGNPRVEEFDHGIKELRTRDASLKKALMPNECAMIAHDPLLASARIKQSQQQAREVERVHYAFRGRHRGRGGRQKLHREHHYGALRTVARLTKAQYLQRLACSGATILIPYLAEANLDNRANRTFITFIMNPPSHFQDEPLFAIGSTTIRGDPASVLTRSDLSDRKPSPKHAGLAR